MDASWRPIERRGWRSVPWIALAGVAYCLAARASLLLAIPPGYATAVWPAAGLALAAVLLFGRRAAIGVWAGSCAANVWASLDSRAPQPPATLLAVAAALGVGAALQAMIGATLVRRFVGRGAALTDGRHIAAFLALGGPVACLVAASCAMATLVLAGQIPRDAVPFSAFTWWVGDTIGVLLFAPLALAFLGRPASVWRPRRLTVGVPLCVTFAAAVCVFVFASRAEQARNRAQFDRRADDVTRAIASRIERSGDALRALTGLFRSADRVTRAQFATFVAGVRRPDDGIQAMSWVRRIDDAGRDALEAAERAAGAPDFRVVDVDDAGRARPAARRDAYGVVTYIEPIGENRAAVGLDSLGRAQDREAMTRACDAGAPAISASIRLVQDDRDAGRGRGALLFAPLFRRDAPHDSVDDRRAGLVGFTTAVFRVGDLVDAALATVEHDGLGVRLVDAAAAPRLDVLCEGGDLATLARGAAGFAASTTIDVGGRAWRVEVAQGSLQSLAHRTFQSWTILVGGLLLTCLLGGFLLALTGRAALVEALVAERTDDLTKANARLAGAQAASVGMMAALRESRDAAREAAATKSAFLANMSHEVRTPMTAILGFADLLAEPGHPADVRADLAATIRRNGRHLLDVLNDVLDASKIESGRMAVERVDCDVRQILADVVEAMRPLALDKRIALALDVAPAAPARLVSDPTRLRQVLFNLVANAVKFTPDGGRVDVRVRAEPRADVRAGARQVVIEIADTGIGIAPAQLGRLFRPFVQADESTTRRFGGTGLGLTICKQLVEMLGGSIDVASAEGVGSTFTVRLDATAATAATANAPIVAPVVSPIVTPQSTPVVALDGRVLIVDDSADIRRLIGSHLGRAGVALAEAEDGRVAVDSVVDAIARGHAFDLILMDMQMPDLDGYQATAQLRRLGVRTPIVAMTADAMPGDRQRCLDAGCDGYASKPIDVGALLAEVARHLRAAPAAPRPLALFASAGPRLTSAKACDATIAPLLPAYVAELARVRHALRDDAARGDLAALRRTLHALKGSGGSYGFASITDLADAATRALADDGLTPASRDRLESLAGHIDRIDGVDDPSPCAAST